MRYGQKGFSIIFAIIIIIIASSMSIYLLSFVVPYSRNVKGLENSTKAYYVANAWIESALWDKSQNILWFEETKNLTSNSQWYGFEITATGSLIPSAWQWNSNFDDDWNILGYSSPIQLSIGDGMIDNWANVKFDFRVPDLDGDGNNLDQSIETSQPVVLTWQLSSPWKTLLPTNATFISPSNINSSSPVILSSKQWVELDNSNKSFSDFYNANCSTSSSPCTLKISVIWDLVTWGPSSTQIPYLEYQIDTGWQNIPLRFTNIHASGKSYGFKKEIHVQIPQLTTDQAFDFALFQ